MGGPGGRGGERGAEEAGRWAGPGAKEGRRGGHEPSQGLMACCHGSLYEWFVCGGGTVTLTLASYFTMFCMSSRRHQHFRQGSVLKTLGVVVFATLLQAALCAFAVGGS